MHIPVEKVELCAWSDASWANAVEKKSQQGGFLIAACTAKLRMNQWGMVFADTIDRVPGQQADV